MRRKSVQEPEPVWADAPRLCPQRAFPVYRYLPGITPRPELPIAEIEPTALNADDEALRFGIDLYHQGYFWEAHEVWEGLWHRAGRKSPEGQLVQALIWLAAALLKAHLGSMRGAARHSQKAFDALCRLRDGGNCDERGRLLGVNVLELADNVHVYFASLWDVSHNLAAPVVVNPPRIDWRA